MKFAAPFTALLVSTCIINAAFARAKAEGATLVEGYPVKPSNNRMPDTFAYYGTVAMFEKAGFDEAAAPSKSKRIMTRRARRR